MRQHLAGERGNVTPCEDVPEDVNVRIQQHLGFEVLEKLRKQKEANPAKNSYFPYFPDKGGDDDDAWPLQKMATRGRGKEVLEGTSNRTKRHKKQHLQMVVPVVARPLLQKFASRQGLYCCFKIYIRSWSTISAANCYSYSFQQMADSIALAGYEMPSYNALRGRFLSRSAHNAGEYCTELRMSWEVHEKQH